MILENEVIRIGYLSRTHGKQGNLQCQIEQDLIAEADPAFVILRLDGILTPFRLDDWREKNSEAYILTLSGIDTEEKAQRLCGTEVNLLRRDICDNPEEEAITMRDLIGFEVFDTEKGFIGNIEDVDESTLNTLVQITGDIVLPLHDDFVQDIDYSCRKLTLNLPTGLLE